MRRSIFAVIFGILALSLSGNILAADADLKGAQAGKWTMDLAAAKKLAKEKELPILLNFSGSDWCGWCKLMERNVFTKADWKDYAKDNLVMVLVDFPKDKTKVPAEFVARNKELKEKHKVRGFPSFILLESDCETVLGKLGAGKEKTPSSFIAEIAQLTRYRAASIAKYASALEPEAKAEYLAIVNQIPETTKAIKQKQEQIAKAKDDIEELKEKTVEIKASARKFRAGQLGDEELKEYTALTAELEAAEKVLKDWLATEPDRSKENTEKFKSLSATVKKLEGKLSKY